MTRRAWAYIWSVLLAGAVLSGQAILANPALPAAHLLTFVALTALTIVSQFLEVEAPGRQSYYPHLVFLFAGALLLPSSYFALLVLIPHVAEWIRKRLAKSPLLRNWYIQPFNIATHLIAGAAARWLFTALVSDATAFATPASLLAVTLAAVVYVLINHLLVGLALLLARGISLRGSCVLAPANLAGDLVQLYQGYVVAILWTISPWLIVPALSPLVMIYRALMVPQLKQEAQTDPKTGLWNARHFNALFNAELDRAGRFNRPLALIMADFDLLRNVNNTYGHLAGDAVLAAVGRIIREAAREYDIPARFGGDEFCIGLPEAGPDEARVFAERLRTAIASTAFEVPNVSVPIHVTMSLGIACFPSDATTLNDLIHQADVAVYQAKLKGGNCTVYAADVPHSVKLEHVPGRDPAEVSPITTPSARPRPADEARAAPQLTSGQAAAEDAPGSPWLPWFVGGVIGAGVLITILDVALATRPDWMVVGLLVILAAMAELFQVRIYGICTVSVSVSIGFASALIAGISGVACVSAGIVLVHYLRTRVRLYKTAFNWATHLLAGSVPALGITAWPIHFDLSNLPTLLLFTLVTGSIYYLADTGLIASAIGLSARTNIMAAWREQFGWLRNHYLVLCVMGMFLSVAGHMLGLPGLIVFALPPFMMHYAQKQYVERTETSVRELKRMNRELTLANQEIAGASRAMRALNDELFLTLAKIIDARDPYASGHAAKVTDYALAIARELGLQAERLERIRQAALLHDIGKLGIPEDILHKPAGLTPDEYATMKTHATLGAEFLDTCRGLRQLAPIIAAHHEWWDGSGYPGRLKGEQIPLEGRILAVCDAVEAMASDRPYHRAMSVPEIVAELRRCAGSQFDPAVVDAFVHVVEQKGPRFVVNSAQEVSRQREAGWPNGRHEHIAQAAARPVFEPEPA